MNEVGPLGPPYIKTHSRCTTDVSVSAKTVKLLVENTVVNFVTLAQAKVS